MFSPLVGREEGCLWSTEKDRVNPEFPGFRPSRNGDIGEEGPDIILGTEPALLMQYI
jgi:hypothetical protein